MHYFAKIIVLDQFCGDFLIKIGKNDCFSIIFGDLLVFTSKNDCFEQFSLDFLKI